MRRVFLASEAAQGKSRKEERLLGLSRGNNQNPLCIAQFVWGWKSFLHTLVGVCTVTGCASLSLFSLGGLNTYCFILQSCLSPWTVKTGRWVVIFFFFLFELAVFPGFVPAHLLVVQGDATLLLSGYPAMSSSSLSDIYWWVTAWNTGSKLACEHPLFAPWCFPYGRINFQSSLIENKTTS